MAAIISGLAAFHAALKMSAILNWVIKRGYFPPDLLNLPILGRDFYQPQSFQFPADDESRLGLGSPILSLRQIVQRSHILIPQIYDNFRHVHLVVSLKFKKAVATAFLSGESQVVFYFDL
jgi:hypothetical protein